MNLPDINLLLEEVGGGGGWVEVGVGTAVVVGIDSSVVAAVVGVGVGVGMVVGVLHTGFVTLTSECEKKLIMNQLKFDKINLNYAEMFMQY